MTADRDQSIDKTLRNLNSSDEPFLKEPGLLRAIQNNKLIREDSKTGQVELVQGGSLGDFVIERKISQGGMGVIYLATQKPLGRQVALKTVIPGKANEFMLARFRREREILGELHESNIVPIFAAGSEADIEYFAMPFIHGLSIKSLVSENLIDSESKTAIAKTVRSCLDQNSIQDDPQSELNVQANPPSVSWYKAIAAIMTDLANGVTAIHDRGIIHRDITPNNVLLDVNGRAWLIDFGIGTRLVNKDGGDSSEINIYKLSTDGGLGTPRYKAPELESGAAGKHTDVFGLGVCFYCLLNNSDFSWDHYLEGLRTGNNNYKSSIPRPLVAICSKALNEDPGRRYQTARQLSDDLRCWLNNEPVSAMGYRLHHRMGLWLKRNPIKSILTISAFLILASISIAAFVNVHSMARAREAELKTKLSNIESALVAGRFEQAAGMVSKGSNILEISAENDPGLFLKLVSMMYRTQGIEEALLQINRARSRSDNTKFLARLDLMEANLLVGADFEKSELLARKALDSNKLDEAETQFAQALLATDAIAEQLLLKRVVGFDPYNLRAQQLLVANYIFLGQESRAREQLAGARARFPSDRSLQLAEALLTRLYTRNDVIIRSGKLSIYFPTFGESSPGVSLESRFADPDWRKFDDADEVLHNIIDNIPRNPQFESADNNVVVEEIDDFLIDLFNLQEQLAGTGLVVFSPSLYRVLSDFEPVNLVNTHPKYWPSLEKELQPVADANPNMEFIFSLARSIYSRPQPNAKEWLASEKLLERALKADSIFPIKPMVIQQLALTRIQIYYYNSGKSQSAKERMVEALRLLNLAGRMPDLHLFDNLVEACYEAGEFDLAANFCQKWRAASVKNGSNDQKANAFGYSAMVALRRNDYFNASEWSSEAIKIAPNHKYNTAHRNFLKQSADKLPETVRQIVNQYQPLETKSDFLLKLFEIVDHVEPENVKE